MALCKNHDHVYFDKLCRTKKLESVQSLIYATHQSKINAGTKQDIARLLKNAYELFKFDAGTYTGTMNAFSSQYTIGHEMGIWINSELDLSPLAYKVALNDITIKEYFDIVFLNYIQPVDNICYNLLYLICEYLQTNNLIFLTKDNLKEIFSFASKKESNDINGLYNFLICTSYFSVTDSRTLKVENKPSIISSCCNLEYHEKEYQFVEQKLCKNEDFAKYLQKDNRCPELINSLKINLQESYLTELNKEIKNGTELENDYTRKSMITNNQLVGFNKIYYGIPGCGKSYKVTSMLKFKDGFQKEALKNGIDHCIKDANIYRTTFYLDYSNSDFVGQIYPDVKYDEDDKERVIYRSIPGPFTKALVQAYTHPDEMIYLIIEEINRGNSAAIFGDSFQLLDRVKKPENGKVLGESEYPISNEFIEGYLKQVNEGRIEIEGDISLLQRYINHNIVIPNNLTIFATMNTSDQNVFPLDTAFKRRWDLERVNIDWSKKTNSDYTLEILNLCIPFTDMTWGGFINSINEKMLDDELITEDKNIGPFFISEDILVKREERYDLKHADKLIKFMNNVVDYLYNDVTRFDHEILFKKNIKYSELYDYFTNDLIMKQDKRYLDLFGNNITDDIKTDEIDVEENENGDTE